MKEKCILPTVNFFTTHLSLVQGDQDNSRQHYLIPYSIGAHRDGTVQTRGDGKGEEELQSLLSYPKA